MLHRASAAISPTSSETIKEVATSTEFDINHIETDQQKYRDGFAALPQPPTQAKAGVGTVGQLLAGSAMSASGKPMARSQCSQTGRKLTCAGIGVTNAVIA